jgi:aminoglycoside phosphotransferase (APT) family kinase protein
VFSDEQLTCAVRLLRSLHDATTDFEGKGASEVVCHGDASPCNCVFLRGVPYAFIDFDEAHPGSRTDDLGYAAWLWLDMGNEDISVEAQRPRLQGFFREYGSKRQLNAVETVMAAQSRLMTNAWSEPVYHWSKDCLEWTRRHRKALEF